MVHPAPLSLDAVSAAVREAIPDAGDALCLACNDATSGNPFYLRELLAHVGSEAVEWGPDGAAFIEHRSPASVSRAVLARLARLGDGARRFAEAIAVLGDGTPLRLGAELSELGVDDAVRAADALAQADILEPGEPLGFAHPIVRVAVYEGIPAGRRAHDHLRAARLAAADHAQPEAVAAHLLAAERGRDEWVVQALRAAAESARARGAPAAAARYLRRAREEAPAATRVRGETLSELGLAEAEAGEGAPIERLAEAAELLPDDQRKARVLLELGFVHGHAGRYADAEAAVAQGLAVAAGRDSALDADLETLGILAAAYGLLPEGRERSRGRLAAMLRRPHLEEGPAGRALLANAAVTEAYAGTSAGRVVALATRAIARREPTAHPFDTVAFSLATLALVTAGELDTAERVATVALAAARRRGSVLETAPALHVRSLARHQAGALADAIADSGGAVEWEHRVGRHAPDGPRGARRRAARPRGARRGRASARAARRRGALDGQPVVGPVPRRARAPARRTGRHAGGARGLPAVRAARRGRRCPQPRADPVA